MNRFLKAIAGSACTTALVFGGYLGVLQLTGNFHEVLPAELYRSALLSRRTGLASMLYLQQIAGTDEEIGSCRSATVTSAFPTFLQLFASPDRVSRWTQAHGNPGGRQRSRFEPEHSTRQAEEGLFEDLPAFIHGNSDSQHHGRTAGGCSRADQKQLSTA